MLPQRMIARISPGDERRDQCQYHQNYRVTLMPRTIGLAGHALHSPFARRIPATEGCVLKIADLSRSGVGSLRRCCGERRRSSQASWVTPPPFINRRPVRPANTNVALRRASSLRSARALSIPDTTRGVLSDAIARRCGTSKTWRSLFAVSAVPTEAKRISSRNRRLRSLGDPLGEATACPPTRRSAGTPSPQGLR